MNQATATATPLVSPVKQVIIPTFAAVAARRSQPSKKTTVSRKAIPAVIRGTKQEDEESITANPLRAKGPPSHDFAIRGVPRHVTAEQLKDYLQGIGVKPRFVRIVPFGPDDTKSSTVGRMGVSASDVDLVLKAENWSSNISITPGKLSVRLHCLFNALLGASSHKSTHWADSANNERVSFTRHDKNLSSSTLSHTVLRAANPKVNIQASGDV
ncbi:hypothetical protein RvY_06944 [Ramazzottius varieornatus]|uniref:Uncharacterized protein n=1 Tax=Ramazzottius varieornatus TaxID=947166 RepID=A0A1D1V5K5_RAMVA|nr:hypothetical protein RvY_06944 [Ramazzottius varieornatus]